MMNGTTTYVDVWQIYPIKDANGNEVRNAVRAQITTSHKDENEKSGYKTDFSDYMNFYDTKKGGTAASDLRRLADGNRGSKKIGRIKLTNWGVSNYSKKIDDGKYRRYYTFTCFGWEPIEQYQSNNRANMTQKPSAPDRGFVNVDDSFDGDEMPFD